MSLYKDQSRLAWLMKYVNVTRKDIDSRMRQETSGKPPAKPTCPSQGRWVISKCKECGQQIEIYEKDK